MKKRKPPIVLVTLVVLLAGGAFAFNYSTQSSQETPDPRQQQQQQQQQQAPDIQKKPGSPLGAPRKAQDAKSVGDAIKNSFTPSTRKMPNASSMDQSAMARKLGYKPGDSSLTVKRHPDEKPKKSDTSPYSQWWGDSH